MRASLLSPKPISEILVISFYIFFSYFTNRSTNHIILIINNTLSKSISLKFNVLSHKKTLYI